MLSITASLHGMNPFAHKDKMTEEQTTQTPASDLVYGDPSSRICSMVEPLVHHPSGCYYASTFGDRLICNLHRTGPKRYFTLGCFGIPLLMYCSVAQKPQCLPPMTASPATSRLHEPLHQYQLTSQAQYPYSARPSYPPQSSSANLARSLQLAPQLTHAGKCYYSMT